MHRARVDRPARRLHAAARPIPRSWPQMTVPGQALGEGSGANGPSYSPSCATDRRKLFFLSADSDTTHLSAAHRSQPDGTDGKGGLIRAEPVRDRPPGHGPPIRNSTTSAKHVATCSSDRLVKVFRVEVRNNMRAMFVVGYLKGLLPLLVAWRSLGSRSQSTNRNSSSPCTSNP